MKKILLIFAALSAYCSASALELTFMLGNKKIAPGETVEFTDIVVNDYGDYQEAVMKPELYLTTDLYSSKIKVTATCTSGQQIQLCAGGTCRGGESVTKENVTIQTNQKLDLGFDFITELDPGEAIPVVTTAFEAEDASKPDTKKQFILVMSENGASLTEITASDAIHGVEGGIAYTAPTACQLTVTNLSGINVFSAKVAGEGSISLAPGIYIYCFGDKTGKLYIH